MEFEYYLPAHLIFGRGKVGQAGKEAAKAGTKALIVTGHSSTKKSGLLYKVEDLLRDEGIGVEIFAQVEQNPLASTAYEGAARAKAAGCDVIVGVGGGSIMDCAKIISFLLCNEGDIFDYIFGKKVGTKRAGLVLIPTTCGTGSEGNGFGVITNPDNFDKKSLRTPVIVADASIIDPEVMTTMPKHVLASVGFDALCHCMEAYLSRITQPLVEYMALDGIRLVKESLIDLYRDPSDMGKWEKLSWASTLGGMCIHTAQVTAPHGIEHPASGLRNIVHGHGLAALTPIIYEMSINSAPEKFGRISQLLGGTGAGDCVDVIRDLIKQIGMETTLSKEGVKAEDVDWMTENCMKISMAGIQNHPRIFTKEEVSEIYYKAL